MIRIVRWFLFPFSLLYWLGIWIRNCLFDKKILKSITFDVPTIGVGNLSTGGTGKTPMIEYLIRLLQKENNDEVFEIDKNQQENRIGYHIASLSRGYKRRSKGVIIADEMANAETIGDEAFQLKRKFSDVHVCVAEDRILAIPELMWQKPNIEVVLLDDVFQHRYLDTGYQVLLTTHQELFTNDWFLPTGNLRDLKSSYKRADTIVVTKCPDNLAENQQAAIRQKINPLSHQKVFFSKIVYKKVYPLFNPNQEIELSKDTVILLVTGIANNKSLMTFLTERVNRIEEMQYIDHHFFTRKELDKIRQRFDNILESNKLILTTEKDATRLLLFKDLLKEWHLPIYCLPIEMEFLKKQQNNKQQFDNRILEYLKGSNL